MQGEPTVIVRGHTFVQGARADNDFCWYQHNPDDRGRGVRCGVHRKFHETPNPT